jgi:hypothetical protein
MTEKVRPFNIFRNLGLNENQHSNFLLKFLSPKGSHNQGVLFIKEFLKVVKIDTKILDNISINDISVSTEQKAGKRGRVDLLIKIGEYKIIVENKINGAKSTNNQLYRYWKNLIFDETGYRSYFQMKKLEGLKKLNDFDTHSKFHEERQADKYKLCFLTKSTKMTVNESYEQSLQRHSFYDINLFPERLPIDVIKLGYKEDIIIWLNNCLPQIEKNTKCSESDAESIKIIIKQYIKHLEET